MKWFKKLEIQNFESHKNTVIDFSPGINVFIGDSDSGKSSILRALSWLCYNDIVNASINESIRNDPERQEFEKKKRKERGEEFECIVSLTLSDDTVIQRIRGLSPQNNKYILINSDGKKTEYTNFRQGVPEDISQALGFSEYALAGKSKLKVNYLSQHEPPLSMSISNSELSQLLNLSNNLDIFDLAHQKLRTKTQGNSELTQSIKILKQKIEEQEAELSSMPEVDFLIEKIDDISKKIVKLENLENNVDAANNIINSYAQMMQRRKEIRSELSKNRRILELEKSLLQCNELEKDSSRSLKIIKSYDKLKNQYKNISKSYKKYNKLQNINLSKNNSIISSISIAYLIIADWENRNNDLEKLEKESMQNKNSIQENREKLAELSNSIINMIADECEFCPMCGSLTTDDSRNKIRTYLEEQNPNN
jgi:exonuclease SbcC